MIRCFAIRNASAVIRIFIIWYVRDVLIHIIAQSVALKKAKERNAGTEFYEQNI